MTASLTERLLPLLVMIAATLISAGLIRYALYRRWVVLREDIIFIAFWFQTWVYLHAIPTLNVMFPESAFAFPAFQSWRVIRFTSETVQLYAVFQVLGLILFYVPLLYVYLRCRARWQPAAAPVVPVRVFRGRLLLLALVYSAFSLLFMRIVLKHHFLSAYAGVLSANLMVSGAVPASDYYLYRLYLLSILFFTMVLILAYAELAPKHQGNRWAFYLTAGAGLIGLGIWTFCRSRALLVFVIGLTGLVLYRRGLLRVSRHVVLVSLLGAILAVYLFSVIVKLRGVILQPEVAAGEIAAVFDPRRDLENVSNYLLADYGARLDGWELMVLATPRMMERGLTLGPLYIGTVFSPLMNFVPGLKASVLRDRGDINFKQIFIAEYTGMEYEDYMSVALTDIFAVLGPLGFIAAGVVYAWLLSLAGALLAVGRKGRSAILGIFILAQVFSFEAAFAALFFGWIRSLPMLIIVLALNPWRGGLLRKR